MNRVKYPAGLNRLTLMLVVTALLLLSAAVCAQLTSSGKPAYPGNQLIVRFSPGTTDAQAAAKAQDLGMKVVKKMEVPDTYLLERLPSRAGTSIETIKTRAASTTGVASAEFNYFRYPCAIPNDPMWSQLWGMVSIRAPQAWDTVKGSSTVYVAVIDSGVFTSHEDLQGRLLPGRDVAGASWEDPNDADDDPNPSTNTEIDAGTVSHGTHVTGTIAAQGNNGKGVVGVCWDNVKIVPIKAMADDAPGLTAADLVAAYDYVLNYIHNGKGIDIVNMSYGGDSDTSAEAQKIRELAARGIILVAAAGNDSGPVGYPAAHPEVIAVSAVTKTDDLAPYSNFGDEIDIAAPGGFPPDQILSCWWDPASGPGYGPMSGTSMASPHVAGAAALVMSSGVPRSEVRSRLESTARTPVIGGFIDPRKFGKGIVDVSKALRPPAGTIEILQPKNASALESYMVRFVIRLNKVKRDSIKIWIDFEDKNPADGEPDRDGTGQTPVPDLTGLDSRITYDEVTQTLTFDYELNPDSGGAENPSPTYNIFVSGLQELGPVAKASGIFFINPKSIQQGVHLFSFPYPLDAATPDEVIHAHFELKRWDPTLDQGRGGYRVYARGDGEDAWTLFTSDAGVRPNGSATDTPPVGMGFWLDLSSSAPISITGDNSLTSKGYDIDLVRPHGSYGWNMIGNPFPFSVNWGTVTFSYRGSTLTMDEAVKAEWIRPTIFRYENGQFRFDTAPAGVLAPWQGYWVRALVGDQRNPLTMTVPPLQAAAASSGISATRATASEDGWFITLKASAGGSVDSYNFAGVSTRASDGFDLLDVEAPPQIGQKIDLSFVHRDWGENSGRFAKDMRSSIGSGKTWEFEVYTSLANQDVQISWPGLDTLPKQYRAVLEDVDSGNKVFMATRSSYTYNSGASGGVRHFRLSIAPENKGRLLITGVTVTRNRGAGVTIAYSVSRDARVEVKLRNAGNRTIRTLGGNTTRAAGMSSVVWDGKLPDGSQAPSGLYICEIVATDTEGELAKTVRPIVLK